jgi:ABC-type Fe3+ transport system permease subunit
MQLPMIGYFVSLVALTFFMFALFFVLGYNEYITSLKSALSPLEFSKIELALNDARDATTTSFIFSLIVSVCCTLVAGVYMSHRVAGPLYRLRLTLKQIVAERKPVILKFRKGDYTTHMADEFNNALAAISENSKR